MLKKRIFMQRRWKFWTSVLTALSIAAILVSTAGAGSVHFTSLSFSYGSLDMTGSLAGLGNNFYSATMTGYGTVTAICQNNGGNQAPGRNPISINVTQSETVTTDSNGNALVQISDPDPTLSQISPSPTPKTAGCPSSQWIVVGIEYGSTNWTGANITVRDINGVIQLSLNFTCTTTFNNGAGNVSCTQS